MTPTVKNYPAPNTNSAKSGNRFCTAESTLQEEGDWPESNGVGLLSIITDHCFLSPTLFSYLSAHRSQCLGPRPAELSSSLEQSGHRSQPDLYLWAAVAGRVYVITPEKPTCLGKRICLRSLWEWLEKLLPLLKDGNAPVQPSSSGSAPFSYLGKHCHLVEDATKHTSKHSRGSISEWPLMAIFSCKQWLCFYTSKKICKTKMLLMKIKEGVELVVCFWMSWRWPLLSPGHPHASAWLSCTSGCRISRLSHAGTIWWLSTGPPHSREPHRGKQRFI